MDSTALTTILLRFLWLRWRAMAAVAIALLVGITSIGCAVKRIAVNKLGNAIASGGTIYASDNDPELVQSAVPFSLKLMESLLEESPKHRGLLLAACKGFTEYSYAFVQEDADEIEGTNLAEATRLRARARRLDLRARDYGLRGLEARHLGFGTALRQNPRAAVQRITSTKEVPLLYWTAASWGKPSRCPKVTLTSSRTSRSWKRSSIAPTNCFPTLRAAPSKVF